MGKVHNGDTIGTIYTDAFFEAFKVDDVNSQRTYIYPNPINTNQVLKINTKTKINY